MFNLTSEQSELLRSNEHIALITNPSTTFVQLLREIIGQMELAKRLEHQKKANFFQRIGTYCRIEKIPAEEQLKNYVETRLQRAGGTGKIFRKIPFMKYGNVRNMECRV